jgi:uncharacterized UPF0146 family protein
LWPIFFSSPNAFKNIATQFIKTAQYMNLNRDTVFFPPHFTVRSASDLYGLRPEAEMSFFILTAAEMTGDSAWLNWLIHNTGDSKSPVCTEQCCVPLCLGSS